MTREELLEKIKKLLALSESSNPHEAAIALSRAQMLMAKFNIQKDAIDNDENIGLIELKPQTGLKNSTITKNICAIISKAFGVECVFYSNKSSIDKILMFGQKDILDSCEYIFVILSRTVYTAIKLHEFGLKIEALLKLSHIGSNKLREILTSDGVDFCGFIILAKSFEYNIENNIDLARNGDIQAQKIIKNVNKDIDKIFKDAPYCKSFINRFVAQSKKGFISGYLSAIYKNVMKFADIEEIDDNIKTYMASYFEGQNLVTKRSRRTTINSQAALDAFETGIEQGKSVNIKTAINSSVKPRKLLK